MFWYILEGKDPAVRFGVPRTVWDDSNSQWHWAVMWQCPGRSLFSIVTHLHLRTSCPPCRRGVRISPLHTWEDSGPERWTVIREMTQLLYSPGNPNQRASSPCNTGSDAAGRCAGEKQARLLPGFCPQFPLKVWGCVLPTLDLASPGWEPLLKQSLDIVYLQLSSLLSRNPFLRFNGCPAKEDFSPPDTYFIRPWACWWGSWDLRALCRYTPNVSVELGIALWLFTCLSLSLTNDIPKVRKWIQFMSDPLTLMFNKSL